MQLLILCSDNRLAGRRNRLSWLLWHFVSLFLIRSKSKKKVVNLAHFVSFNRRSDDGRNVTFNERLLPIFSGRSRIFHTGGPNPKGCALIYFLAKFLPKTALDREGGVPCSWCHLGSPMTLLEKGIIHQLHWQISLSKGYTRMRATLCPISFIFMQFSRKKLAK